MNAISKHSRRIRRILFLTGTRADFGKLKPLMLKVNESDAFECDIFITGMHTMKRYGFTYLEIEKHGFKNTFQYMNQMNHTSNDMDLVLASTIQGLGHYVREYPPDLILVHGDRVEALSGAMVGALNNILVAHVEGGELSGTIDEVIRHAISKMSHLHFVANKKSRMRLIQMGENPETIFVIGSPDVDIMRSNSLPTIEEVKKYYEIPFDAYGIFLFHPVTTELHDLMLKIEIITDALKSSGWNFVVIYPNNDTGAEIILEAYERLKSDKQFRIISSLRFEYFLTLLKNARAIVGNSSAGVREAPVYCIPTINIGSRQHNRYSYPTIKNVAENKSQILEALSNLPCFEKPSLDFGNGNSAELFEACLMSPSLWDVPCQKQFRDINIPNSF